MTDVSLRMRGSTLAVIAVCSTLCACSAGDDAPASPLALYKGEANQDNALLMGTLSLEGRCLYVTPEAAQATGVHALILLPATAASCSSHEGC